MTDLPREIMPIVFFGYEDRISGAPSAPPSGDPMVQKQLNAARRRDFRPRPVPSDAPDLTRRTKIEQDEAREDVPKGSSAIESVVASSDDSTPNRNPESQTSQSEPPAVIAPAVKEQTPQTLQSFDPLENL